jgi:uroporphyrinogen III methyltransferase / synthase
MKRGIVYLIGAGPGDPGLITLKGIDYLRRADTVVYDQLIGDRILDIVPQGVEKIFVGKTGDQHFAEQEQINALLVKKARQGKIVARLKGGDPFVFGRGGEEAQFLKDNGIGFEIVPGITSAVAVPEYAGIPVTQRGLASSVAIITGHEDPLKKGSSINWRKLATAVDTLVFLMGMQNLAEIATRLIESGCSPDTPVAVIKDGTLPTQKVVAGTLGNIAAKAKRAKMAAPAVIVVGKVAELRDQLKWFDTMPLFGKGILITRAGAQSRGFERLLIERGARPIVFPLIEIKPIVRNKKLDDALGRLTDYDWIIFTSVNGVELFFERLHSLGLDARALAKARIAAIGPSTGVSLRKQGLCADYVPGKYTGRDMVSGMKKLGISGARVLLPRADIADNEISSGLVKLGAMIDEFAIYHTVKPGFKASELKRLLSDSNVDIITFASSSTVTNFVNELTGKEISQIKAKIACIGPKTAATAGKAGLTVDIIAEEQTMAGLARAIEDHITKEK